MLGHVQTDLFPGLAGIGRFINTVAVMCHHTPDRMLAHPDINHIRIALGYRDRSDRSELEVLIGQHVLTEEAVVVEDVSALVLALGHEPVDDLLAGLDGYPGEVHAIGDCVAPRTAEEAVLEGLKVASEI